MSRASQDVMTSTTYAVLGLLCVQPWSAYELAQQMARSLHFMWPRAESGIYREPQKLIGLGYATAEEAAAGPRRTKLVYSATPAGRRAFQQWLEKPSSPPQFESEAMVKFFFCDQGTLDDARRALEELRAHAEAMLEAFRQITRSHQPSSGPFPGRQHIGTLTGRFVFDYATALTRWAEWARQHVDEWPGTGPEAAPMGAKAQRENARLSAPGAETAGAPQ
jgi:PadR family transcriptional regulator, regulatory protein AphA